MTAVFNATFSAAKQIKALLDSEERSLTSKCTTIEHLFHPHSNSAILSERSVRETPFDIEPTKLTIQSGDKTFEYNSLDEIFERIAAEEDLINRNACDSKMNGAASNLDHLMSCGMNSRLVGGLRKLQDYYNYRRKHREISQSSADLLTGLENLAVSSNQLHDPDTVSALSSHLSNLNQRRLKEETPLRFCSEHPADAQPAPPLIEQIQDIFDRSLNADFAEITADTPRLPSILHTASVLHNIERPKRLIFMKQ